MNYQYSFNRNEDVEYTGQFIEEIQTNVRGSDVTLNELFSGVETFTNACGFQLNGSGIGLVDKE